ncbi:MAG: hypothetical protein QMD12_02955 [Candidatus Aenigmarchaeota archaeon]|nr:hypothetical protein [Candidatus Aenigmarchaeota archaeon]
MSLEREAAINLRKIWQAHDERNEAKGWIAATNLYKILGAKPEQASCAGFLTIQAFLLADEAERYRGKNSEMEDLFYNKAKKLLMKAREVCDLETESPVYTVQWWKAYRHKDREGVSNGLIEEHKAQFLHLTPDEREKYAKLCAQKMIDAATKGHDAKSWSLTDKMLEDYFQVYLEALKQRSDK